MQIGYARKLLVEGRTVPEVTALLGVHRATLFTGRWSAARK